jgi:superkiller protein 3
MIIYEKRLRALLKQGIVEGKSDDLMEQGGLVYQEKKYTKARVIEKETNNAQAWNLKEFTLWKLKQYEVAVGAYRMAVKQDPDYARPWINLGNALFSLDRYREASNSFKKVLEINPEGADDWHDWATTSERSAGSERH